MLVLLFVYTVGHIFSYLNVFHISEMKSLSSFERYLNIVFGGLIFIPFLCLVDLMLKIAKKKIVIIMILSLFTVYFCYNMYTMTLPINKKNKDIREDMLDIKNHLANTVAGFQPVFFGDEYPRLILQYELRNPIMKLSSKEKANMIIIYKPEERKEDIISYIRSNNLPIKFEDLKSNTIIKLKD